MNHVRLGTILRKLSKMAANERSGSCKTVIRIREKETERKAVVQFSVRGSSEVF